jgi:iron complex transport system substrate-binding protein
MAANLAESTCAPRVAAKRLSRLPLPAKLPDMKRPRIASLISSATEMLYLLGLGEQVVGISHECDYPADVAAKPRLTRSLVEAIAPGRAIDQQVRSFAADQLALYAIDVEMLAELAPDLIVTQAQCDVCAVRYEDVVAAVRGTPALSKTQVLALNPQALADVFDDILRVGEAAGARESAAKAKHALEARVAIARAKTSSLSPDRLWRTACLEWIDPPMIAGNWTPELVAAAGGRSDLATAGKHSGYVPWRQIVEYDPQVIVIMPCGFDVHRAIAEAQVLPAFDDWSGLSAVKGGRVFAVDGNAYFNRSGPRLVDSMEILGHLFHPDLFPLPLGEPQVAWRRLETRGDSLVWERP